VWLTAGLEPGHLAVVTQTSPVASVTESAGQIWTELARRYGPSLVLLEHHPAAEAGEDTETLDLVRIGADRSPRWLGVWPTAEENPDRRQASELVRLVRAPGRLNQRPPRANPGQPCSRHRRRQSILEGPVADTTGIGRRW